MHCPRLGAQFQTQRYSIRKKCCCIHCKVDGFFKRVTWSQEIVFDTSCLTVLITIGTKTTHVMVINSSEEPKSKFTLFHSVKKEDISSAKLLETDKFYSNIKVYSRPSKGKNLTQILNLQYTKNLIYTGYFAVYS